MADLPIMLRVQGLRCVIVGGGSVAVRRAESLLAAGAKVTVIAPAVEAAIEAMPVKLEHRPYQKGDLHGVRLVVIATDDPHVNEQIQREADHEGVLVNRADDAQAGDFSMPAHAHHGPVTLAVHTSGISAQASAAIRRELSKALDPDWQRLLEVVAPFREMIQKQYADPVQRRKCLRQLTDAAAMGMLKTQGEQALQAHCQAIANHKT